MTPLGSITAMKKLTLALAITALALAGCTSEPEDQEAHTQESTPAPENTGSGLTQEDWLDLCGPEGSNPSDPLCEADKNIDPVNDDAEYNDWYGEIHPVGEWFMFTTTDTEDVIEQWEMRIDHTEITTHLEAADDNPVYYSGEDMDAPDRIDATPTDGNEFLRVDYTVKNTTDKPDYLALEASALFTDGEEYAALGDDVLYGENLTADNDNPAGDTQNPNTETNGTFVIEIPAGSDIEGIIIRDVYIGSTAEVMAAVDL